MNVVRYTVSGQVAVLAMDNPPLNALSHQLRTDILAGVDRAIRDPAIKALVLIGTERAFSSGADIKEFDTNGFFIEPSLPTIIEAIELSDKPIVAAISGACMGGGFELALACHYRVVHQGAKLAFPEVKLGLIPGAGGTQRLPRLVGLEAAINLIVSGAIVAPALFKGTALFDEMTAGDLLANALTFANKMAQGGKPVPRVRDRKCEYSQADAYLQFARTAVASVSRGLPAPVRCVDAVGAAVSQSFLEGVKTERNLFAELLQTPESKALRHAFFAERAASKIIDIPEGQRTRPIKSVAVIGAGMMGGGIAMNMANAGIPVWLLEVKPEALQRGLANIRGNYEASVKKGKLKPEQLEERMALVRPTLNYADLADADLVIEAVFEDIGVKQKVFAELDRVTKRGAILATNTSTLDVDRIASFTKRPADVVGLHFFSPANVMKLLEVVRGKRTGKDVLATVMGFAKKIGKTAVVSGVCDGFIGNRMIEQYSRQAMFLLEEGATPAQVDGAIERFGFAMGPFRMSDLAGNDIGWHIRKRRAIDQPQIKYSKIADQLCELGRFGQKTGAGWYRYETGRRDALPDPAVDTLIVAERKALGLAARKIDDSEIVDRLVLALVNEGAQLLDEGIAQRASDIDIVYLMGYGFPVSRGGPMFYSEQVGLFNVVRRMARFAANKHGDAAFWKPAPLLARLAATGQGFAGGAATKPKSKLKPKPKPKLKPKAKAKATRRPARRAK